MPATSVACVLPCALTLWDDEDSAHDAPILIRLVRLSCLGRSESVNVVVVAAVLRGAVKVLPVSLLASSASKCFQKMHGYSVTSFIMEVQKTRFTSCDICDT